MLQFSRFALISQAQNNKNKHYFKLIYRKDDE